MEVVKVFISLFWYHIYISVLPMGNIPFPNICMTDQALALFHVKGTASALRLTFFVAGVVISRKARTGKKSC